MEHLGIYVEPHVRERPSRVNGIYIDLRGVETVSPATVVDAIKSCGIDPRDPGMRFEIIVLIDPEEPPRDLNLISSLWDPVVALDLELLRTTEVLRIAQETYRKIALRIHGGHLQYSLGIIALIVPDITIIPIGARPMIRDLKMYAGAAAGRILVEVCGREALEGLPPIIDGVVLIPCS